MKKTGYIVVLAAVITIQANGDQVDIFGKWYVQPHVHISAEERGIVQDSIVDMSGYPLIWEFLPNNVLNVESEIPCDTSCSIEQRTSTWKRGETDDILIITDIERVRWKATIYRLDEGEYLLMMHKVTHELKPTSLTIWTLSRS
jgi:hypothetical protein